MLNIFTSYIHETEQLLILHAKIIAWLPTLTGNDATLEALAGALDIAAQCGVERVGLHDVEKVPDHHFHATPLVCVLASRTAFHAEVAAFYPSRSAAVLALAVEQTAAVWAPEPTN